MIKEIGIDETYEYMKALHYSIKWIIIKILKEGPLSSIEIHQKLNKIIKDNKEKEDLSQNLCDGRDGKRLKKCSLYYHLRELESVNIIKLEGYRASEQGKAPEKIWKLNIEKLIINFKELKIKKEN